jgi:hypothetical protein
VAGRISMQSQTAAASKQVRLLHPWSGLWQISEELSPEASVVVAVAASYALAEEPIEFVGFHWDLEHVPPYAQLGDCRRLVEMLVLFPTLDDGAIMALVTVEADLCSCRAGAASGREEVLAAS